MSDQSDYLDPASQFPAGLPTDAALLILHNRLTALEQATDNEPEAQDTDPAAVDRPADPYDQATADQRRRFEEWLAAGEPGNTYASPQVAADPDPRSAPRPGLTGSPAGSPAGPVSTGAGPENPRPVAVGENPDPTPDSEPSRLDGPTVSSPRSSRRASH
jgi:hypothetical protein